MEKLLLGMQAQQTLEQLEHLKSTSGSSTSANPTASRLTQVSDRDRHLFHFGTETTIGDPTTQDPMFIRFSNQEDFK